MSVLEKKFSTELEKAGVTINGSRPSDIQVHNKRVYKRVLFEGTLGFGEAYMDGDWDSTDLAELIHRLVRGQIDKGKIGLTGLLAHIEQSVRNVQNKYLSRRVAEKHYDLDNNLYQKMLDPRMVYTCAYFGRGAETLAQAQEDKLRLVCEKIGLKTGQRVLDIGCGWGSFAKFAAEEFGAEVVGITIAKEQLALGNEVCKGLPVKLMYLDYRDIPRTFPRGHFDHVISIGMFEAVGPKNFREYMKAAAWALKPEGLFLLHTIAGSINGFDPWIERYIFPGGIIPAISGIVRSVKDIFVIEDIQNFGAYYDRTLCAWWENFDKAWPELEATGKYDKRFYRMWRYYLLSCAGAFRARTLQLCQFVLSPHGVDGGYKRVS
jgi:cyclopropane-fatty-acyl-phospholipid synthase